MTSTETTSCSLRNETEKFDRRIQYVLRYPDTDRMTAILSGISALKLPRSMRTIFFINMICPNA